MKLTSEQIDQFQAHGVVIVPGILTDADLAPVIAAIESWIDDWANAWLAEGRITDTHAGEGFDTRIRPDLMPDIEPLVAACPQGGIVFMDKWTPHAGITNRTESVRWSMDLRCQTTGVPTGRPVHPDFVVRSAADPRSVHCDFDEWNRRWDKALAASAGYQAHRSIPIEKRSPKS